ncbi:SDR family oxidoreductase [Sunxiuqinia elliptica]|uniref:Nucleoside-diphosphate-sugar epimerase n=1 Tax=Sunxiuqinia elliptica TaxID=655355 RepID=A0A1I2J2F6_9BACT|nr:SDR family oxidoreductase [Sunxiuqinia elliptica]SFF48198.1 Nucleoside-diphosphate-sugar epimerase [Sunxiuqinia elliptica]
MKRISILGCGWLGFPLAEQLLARGFQVKGSVTNRQKLKKLAAAGIQPFRLVLDADKVQLKEPDFFDTDLVIVAIPPRRVDFIETIFPAQIKQLVKYLEQYRVPKVLFISSTSVYNELDGRVTEEDVLLPEKSSGKALVLAEFLLTQNPNFKTTVLRFGGLIGADRNPARFLSRQKKAGSGAKPVNLIHQDDCIQIILKLIDDEVWGETFNACSPQHPSRQEFYEKASEISGLPLPQFSEERTSYKIVDSSKLIQQLNYQFKFASPLDYLRLIAQES